MKNRLLFLLPACIFFLSAYPAFAQEDSNKASEGNQTRNFLKIDTSDTIEPDSAALMVQSEGRDWDPPYKNIVKINVTSLAFKTFSLQYERLLGRKMSVALGVRMMPSSALPFRNAIVNATKSEDGEDDEDLTKLFEEAKLGGLAITPEFRYYLGKEAGRGFYLAPFVRYEHYNLSAPYSFLDASDQLVNVSFKGNMTSYGIGLMIGSQFKLAQRLTLDWWILGPYYSATQLSLKANNLSLTTDDQTILRESLESIEFASVKIESEVTATSASLKAKSGFGGIRAFGLCLGFKF